MSEDQNHTYTRAAANRSDLWEPAERDPWKNDAACRESTVNFFPTRGEDTRKAKAICLTCPVASECLRYAMQHRITDGVWGGTSERQRRGLRATFVRMVPCQLCGTRFEYLHPGKRYCTSECQIESKRLSARRYLEGA